MYGDEEERLAQLRHTLVTRFNESELRDLCFDLGIDYEVLPGTNKADKARELVAHCARRQRIPALVRAIEQARDDIQLTRASLFEADDITWTPIHRAIEETGCGSTYLTKIAQEARVATRQEDGILYFDAQILRAYLDGWINTAEASELTDYTVPHIRWLAREGLIQARKVHGIWLIHRPSLLAYCSRHGRLSPTGKREI